MKTSTISSLVTPETSVIRSCPRSGSMTTESGCDRDRNESAAAGCLDLHAVRSRRKCAWSPGGGIPRLRAVALTERNRQRLPQQLLSLVESLLVAGLIVHFVSPRPCRAAYEAPVRGQAWSGYESGGAVPRARARVSRNVSSAVNWGVQPSSCFARVVS